MDMRSPPKQPPSGGTIKARNISGVPALLAEYGVALDSALDQAGLDRGLFLDQEQIISYRAGGRLLQACAEATGLDDFGVRLGVRQSTPLLGLAGYVGANAPTVRAAIETVREALRLSDTGGCVTLVVEEGFASLSWSVMEPDIPALDHIGDLAMAAACNFMRKLCGRDWRPAEVRLTRKRPKADGAYLAFFAAPVRFESEYDSLIFEERLLDAEVRGRDPLLHRLLSPLLEQALAAADASFRDRICEILRAQIQTGPLTPDRAAAELGISVRTLARRLADEKATFSELAQLVRFEVAQRLLRAGRSVSEIAETLGYSDATTFIRAFKQATGVTPARWRRKS
jgi:AraC-like DNA-binding protein